MILSDSSDPTAEVIELKTSSKDETLLFLFNQYILTAIIAFHFVSNNFRKPSSLTVQYGLSVPVKELLH